MYNTRVSLVDVLMESFKTLFEFALKIVTQICGF